MKPPIENIKLIRKDKNLSREEIAQSLKIDLSTYGKMERGEIGLTLDRLYELAGIFGMTADEILTFSSPKQGNVTYIPISAKAGSLVELAEQPHREDFISFSIPIFNDTELYMIDVDGDSMYDTISHGDQLIIKQVSDGYIRWGEIYVVDAIDGRVTKRIYKHADKNRFILKSDNEMYEPYDILRKDIYSTWHVKGIVSKNLTRKNQLEKRLQVIEENITVLSKNIKSK